MPAPSARGKKKPPGAKARKNIFANKKKTVPLKSSRIPKGQLKAIGPNDEIVLLK
jgi:hypothetical protein